MYLRANEGKSRTLLPCIRNYPGSSTKREWGKSTNGQDEYSIKTFKHEPH